MTHQSSRVHAILAHRGVAARRKCEELVRAGRVTSGGRPVQVGDVLPDDAPLELDGRAVQLGRSERTVAVLHKPVGFLTSRGDPSGLPTIYEHIPARFRGLGYAGRLDFLTSGMLVLTDDGQLIDRLTHPRSKIPKTYEITLPRKVTKLDMERLQVPIGIGEGHPVRFTSVRQTGPKKIEVTIAEGRNRVVRRACQAMNVTLAKLARVGIGSLRLDLMRLPPGEIRVLSAREVGMLVGEPR